MKRPQSAEDNPASRAEKSSDPRSLTNQRLGTVQVDQMELDRLARLPSLDRFPGDEKVIDVKIAMIDSRPVHATHHRGDLVGQHLLHGHPSAATHDWSPQAIPFLENFLPATAAVALDENVMPVQPGFIGQAVLDLPVGQAPRLQEPIKGVLLLWQGLAGRC